MVNERQGRESRVGGSGLNQPFTHNGTQKDTFVSVPKSVSEIQARQRCIHVINSVYKRRAQGGNPDTPAQFLQKFAVWRFYEP